MKKPCTNCESALRLRKGQKIIGSPNISKPECSNCEKYNKYQVFRETKQKYRKGKTIKTVAEFDAYTKEHSFVYFGDRVKHYSILESMPYRVVRNSISRENVSEAIKK